MNKAEGTDRYIIDEPMRIGVNCLPLRPDVGGIRQYFAALIRELSERYSDGFRYILFHDEKSRQTLDELCVEGWQKDAVAVTGPIDIARRIKSVDLYFCPFGALTPRPLSVPAVVTLVDVQHLFYPEFFTSAQRLSRAYHYPASVKMADHVITISRFSKSTIARRWQIPEEKISVAHLAPTAEFVRALDNPRPPGKPLPDGPFVFYPANFWPHKNHDGLLRAIKWLETERGLKVYAVLTGYEQKTGYPINDMVRRYGLGDRIVNLGYVDAPVLAFLYRQAAALVFASRFEGFGIPLVEAMAAGCPIIASRAASIPEVAADAALYFDPSVPEEIGRTIERVLTDDAERGRLIEAGRIRAAAFSGERLARAHIDAFGKAVRAYSTRRYVYLKWIYGNAHKARIALKYAALRLAGKID